MKTLILLLFPILSFGQTAHNGWYKVPVKCTDIYTSDVITSTLEIEVVSGTVAMIQFGNGDEIHQGYNSEDYDYSGGILSPFYDSTGLIFYTTIITITDNKKIKYFDVIIKP